MLEYIRQQRPDTKWVVHLLSNVTFYVNKMNEYPIGASVLLPDYVLRNPGVVALITGSKGIYNDDDLCLFRCLAVHRGAPVSDVESPAKTYFHQYLQHTRKSPNKFKGVAIEDLQNIETLYAINIFVYELKEDDMGNVYAELTRRSPYKHKSTMYLNLFEDHFSYIRDLRSYRKSFSCSKCGKLWKSCWMLQRHERTCEAKVRYSYPGGVYHPNQCIFKKIEEFGIDIPEDLKHYPYRAAYDVEAMLEPTDRPKSNKMEWTSTHVPLNISICSNIPDHDRPICFFSKGDPNVMISKAVKYLKSLSRTAQLLLRERYQELFEEMEIEMTDELDPEDPKFDSKKRKHPLYKLQLQLEGYLQELPVIGFNSGQYDLNAMKISFLSYIAEHENVKLVVNRNNNYMCVKTENLKLLDISNYLATGFSYVQFLKAYGCSEEKGHFPCEWMTTLEKLKHTVLPPKEAFYSSLRNQHISEGDYQHCLDMWQQHNMSTMRDVLVWYNKDVEPMLQAINKMFIYYRNLRLEMFNDGISVPGLTLKYMFQDLPNYFTIPVKRNNDSAALALYSTDTTKET